MHRVRFSSIARCSGPVQRYQWGDPTTTTLRHRTRRAEIKSCSAWQLTAMPHRQSLNKEEEPVLLRCLITPPRHQGCKRCRALVNAGRAYPRPSRVSTNGQKAWRQQFLRMPFTLPPDSSMLGHASLYGSTLIIAPSSRNLTPSLV